MHKNTFKDVDHKTKFPFSSYQTVHGILRVRNEFPVALRSPKPLKRQMFVLRSALGKAVPSRVWLV